MAIRELTEEVLVLRRQVKNLERELRHVKTKLHQHQMRSPQATEEEELDGYIRSVVRRSSVEDGFLYRDGSSPLD